MNDNDRCFYQITLLGAVMACNACRVDHDDLQRGPGHPFTEAAASGDCDNKQLYPELTGDCKPDPIMPSRCYSHSGYFQQPPATALVALRDLSTWAKMVQIDSSDENWKQFGYSFAELEAALTDATKEKYEAFVRCKVCDRRAVISFMGKRVCLHYGAFGMHHVDNACMDECEFPDELAGAPTTEETKS